MTQGRGGVAGHREVAGGEDGGCRRGQRSITPLAVARRRPLQEPEPRRRLRGGHSLFSPINRRRRRSVELSCCWLSVSVWGQRDLHMCRMAGEFQ